MEFNLALVHEAIAAAIPDRESLVFRDRRLTFGQLDERARRLANHLLARGMTVRRDRRELEPHESGQDHLALYLYNGSEYVEGMLGAFKARLAPDNGNNRYLQQQLLHLLRDSPARALLYHEEFAPTLGKIRDRLPELEVLIQVADGSGNDLLADAIGYEEALTGASPEVPDVEWSPDDLYILYTGGTTGQPKGVLWRQGDIFPVSMGGRNLDHSEKASLEEVVTVARRGGTLRLLICPPLMHGAAQWSLFGTLANGNTIVFPTEPRRFDPDDVLSTVERERANLVVIVGDAFAHPLLDQLRRKAYDLSSLSIIASGGAPLSQAHKKELVERIPDITVLDSIGSSETGGQGVYYTNRESKVSTGRFFPVPATRILSAELDRVLSPEEGELGWFAQTGRVPLGYLGDAEKTAKTFLRAGGGHRGAGEGLGHGHFRRREDLRRGSRERPQAAPRGIRCCRLRTTQQAVGPGGRGDRAAPRRSNGHRRGATHRVREASRALQAAQGVSLRTGDRPKPDGKARLPLGSGTRSGGVRPESRFPIDNLSFLSYTGQSSRYSAEEGCHAHRPTGSFRR